MWAALRWYTAINPRGSGIEAGGPPKTGRVVPRSALPRRTAERRRGRRRAPRARNAARIAFREGFGPPKPRRQARRQVRPAHLLDEDRLDHARRRGSSLASIYAAVRDRQPPGDGYGSDHPGGPLLPHAAR